MAEQGQWEEIATYCETDVIALYFLFLRYQLMVGALSQDAYYASEVTARISLPPKLVDRLKPLPANPTYGTDPLEEDLDPSVAGT